MSFFKNTIAKIKRVGVAELFNENLFTIALVGLSIYLGFNIDKFSNDFIQINSTKLINLSLTLGVFFALTKAFMGLKRDVMKEIFDENNIAAAILLGLLALACAISLTVVS